MNDPYPQGLVFEKRGSLDDWFKRCHPECRLTERAGNEKSAGDEIQNAKKPLPKKTEEYVGKGPMCSPGAPLERNL